MLENKVDDLLLILSRELFECHELVGERPLDLFRINGPSFLVVGDALRLHVSPLFDFLLDLINALHEGSLHGSDIGCVSVLGKQIPLSFNVFILNFLVFVGELRYLEGEVVAFLVHNFGDLIDQPLLIVLMVDLHQLLHQVITRERRLLWIHFI